MSESINQANRNLYDVLGIAPNADADEVKRAYRALVRLLHPDVNARADASARFTQVSQAYAVLGDPERRRQYDAGRRVRSTAPVRNPQTSRTSVERGALRGADVEVLVQLSLREAAFGVDRKIDVPRREVCAICVGKGTEPGGTSERCPRCQGTGGTRTPGDECSHCQGSGVIGDPPCPNCQGSGRRRGQTTLIVAIPPGVDDGQVLTLKGDGDAGPRNGPRGDLRLRIMVEPDPVLRRNGIDIMMDLPISAQEAARGMQVEVPTLRGPKRIRVPERTMDKTIVRLGGAGLRLPGSWHRGDQFVIVHVQDDRHDDAD